MSIASELQALEGYISDSYDAVLNKGGTIPQNKNMYNLPTAINSIQNGQIVVPPDAGTLTSIAVTNLPIKTAYYVGEYFNPAGCVVIATYTNTTIDVSSVCTFIVNTPLQGTETSVQVNYEGLTTSFSISVTYPPVPAPSSTLILLHCNGNLNNAVTGDMTNVSGTYTQGQGKFDLGQLVSGSSQYVTLSNCFPTSSPSVWGLGWWSLAGSGNSGNTAFQSQVINSTTWRNLVHVINSSGNSSLQPDTAFNVANLVIDNTIPTADIHSNWNYYAVQIRNNVIYCYINGILTSHADITAIAVDLNTISNRSNSTNFYIDEVIIAEADIFQKNNAEWSI